MGHSWHYCYHNKIMDTRKIINIFNEFDISSTKDESKYKISKLESITNLYHKVEVDDK